MLESFGNIELAVFRFEKPERCFKLCKPWRAEIREMLLDAGITAINLSYIGGCRAENLDFLLELPFIRTVQVFGYLGETFEPIDMSALSQATWLKRLWVDINNSVRSFPSLRKLSELEILHVSLYRQVFSDVLDNPSLQQLPY